MTHRMTYRQFARMYPQYHMPQFTEFLSDPRYVCRFITDSLGQVVNLEVGFECDEWHIK